MHEPPARSRLIVLASPKSHLETVASDRSDLRASASARAKKEGMSSMTGAWLMHPPPVKPSHGGPICLAQRRKMVDRADRMTLRRRIQQRLDALGISMREASLRAGLGTHFVRDLMANPDQSPKADNLAKLAVSLKTSAEWLLEERGEADALGVPIMGYVGAGAHYKPFEDQGALDYAEVPPGASDVFGAAQVRGHSQHPVYRDGDIVYFTEFRDDVVTFVGEDVIAELGDGSMVLKHLEAVSAGGKYHLTSHNAPPIHDAEVLRVAAIRWIDRRPRRR